MKVKELYLKYKEIINYLIIGGLTTLVSLLMYYFLTFTILNPEDAIDLQMANVISWICAVTFAYFTNRKYVFESKNKSFSEIIKFFLARLGTLLIDMGIMYIFVTKMHLNDKIMKILTQVIVVILNYILSKFIVFKGDKNEKKF